MLLLWKQEAIWIEIFMFPHRWSTCSSPSWMSSRRSGRVGSTRPSWFSSLLVKASSTPGPQSQPICFPLPRRGLLRHQVPDLKLKHVSLCRYWNGIELLSMRVFTALSAAVYKKSLTLSSTGRNQYTAGQVRNNNNKNNTLSAAS